jgi:hypothetical protein
MMKKTILALAAFALAAAFNAQALDDADGFKIIQKGDFVWVKPTLALRLYVNKDDLLADERVCGVYDFSTPQFQAMLQHFNDLRADGKAFELHRRELVQVVQNEILHMHGEDQHIAQVKMDGMFDLVGSNRNRV